MNEIKWYKIFDSMEEGKKQIPLNGMKALRFGFQKVCLAHTSEGLFAFEDACPHKLALLSKGSINEENEVVCYWHQYTFDLKSGEEKTDKNIRPLQLFSLELRKEGLYLGLPQKSFFPDDFSY